MKKDNPSYDTMDFFMVWASLTQLLDTLNQNPDKDIPADLLRGYLMETLSYFPEDYELRTIRPYNAFIKNYGPKDTQDTL